MGAGNPVTWITASASYNLHLQKASQELNSGTLMWAVDILSLWMECLRLWSALNQVFLTTSQCCLLSVPGDFSLSLSQQSQLSAWNNACALALHISQTCQVSPGSLWMQHFRKVLFPTQSYLAVAGGVCRTTAQMPKWRTSTFRYCPWQLRESSFLHVVECACLPDPLLLILEFHRHNISETRYITQATNQWCSFSF